MWDLDLIGNFSPEVDIRSKHMSVSTMSSSSPTPSSTDTMSLTSNSSEGEPETTLNTKCSICSETYTIPKVLPCLHTFCQPCLEKLAAEKPEKIVCPDCRHECYLTGNGVGSLMPDFAISNILEASAMDGSAVSCTGCKSKDMSAVARCFDCANFLCPNCVMAHQFMHCFEGHRVLTLGELQSKDEHGNIQRLEKSMNCAKHRAEILRFFCRTCDTPICKECTLVEHSKGHEYDYLVQTGTREVDNMAQLAEQARVRANDLRGSTKTLGHASNRLSIQYHKAQNEIHETYNFYRSMLEKRKKYRLKELDSAFNAKQVNVSVMTGRLQEAMEKLYLCSEFVDKLLKHSSNTEILLFKRIVDQRMQGIHSLPDINSSHISDLEFVSNYQAIQVGIRNTFGYIRQGPEVQQGRQHPQPIARPTPLPSSRTSPELSLVGPLSDNGMPLSNGFPNMLPPHMPPPSSLGNDINGFSSSLTNSLTNGFANSLTNGLTNSLTNGLSNGLANSISSSLTNSLANGLENNSNFFDSNLLTSHNRFPSSSSLVIQPPSSDSIISTSTISNPYEKWSNGLDFLQNGTDVFATSTDPVIDLTSKLISANIYPPKSQIKRQKMIYHCKFGEFGVMEGQFTEPSGVTVNAQNDIIVADTNNHRIQIFDSEGRFKFQFGECGKRDGQLLYPNRVAVVRNSGDIVVTERSPTHQVQVYNQYGQFVRKFGANVLQHPRGVTVDNKGRIIIVECKVMRVLIFDQLGNVLQKFSCSKHLEFPNGVVVNDKEEIFISDNRAHCVKVFSYQGVFLRQIGGEGITNYPIGVGINAAGEILVADNHNNFNLTVFTQDGQLINALESKVKHAQCFDVSLMDEGSIVLASKDYRLYIYRYMQMPTMCM